MYQKCQKSLKFKPVSVFSKQFPRCQKSYSPYDAELLALYYALQRWRMELHSLPSFEIHSDCSALQFLDTLKEPSSRQARVQAFLVQFYGKYKIRYRPGKFQICPDFHSRHPDPRENYDPHQEMQDAWALQDEDLYQPEIFKTNQENSIEVSNFTDQTSSTFQALQSRQLKEQSRGAGINIGNNTISTILPIRPPSNLPPNLLRLISFNVCSIRAIIRKGRWNDFIRSIDPDIICLQETRCPENKFPFQPETTDNFVYKSPGDQIFYSGVAILSKIKPLKVTFGFPDGQHKDRILIAKFLTFTLINIYSPFIGNHPHQNLQKRIDWENQLRKFVATFPPHLPLVLCGDFNTAPEPVDSSFTSPDTPACTPVERKNFQELLQLGLKDTYRELHPNSQEFSFWSYAHNDRENNIGMRLDHFLINQAIVPTLWIAG